MGKTICDLDGYRLPGWVYHDDEFLQAEKRRIFAASRHSSTSAGIVALGCWMRAARYSNWRINRRVSAEDESLIERVQAGMGSRSYSPGPLGRNVVSLRSFARRMPEIIPESRLGGPPPSGWSRQHDARNAHG